MADKVDYFSHMDKDAQTIETIQGVDARWKNKLEYQYYPEEYFTGNDCTIYFGDVWCADVTALSFSLYEPVKPINGYASYTWDEPVRGARTVQGQFRIAFNEAGYLYVILEHLGMLKGKAKPRLAYLMGGETVPDWIAGVKEDIETTLYRYYGNPKAKEPDTKKHEHYLDEFEWTNNLRFIRSNMMTDAKYKNKKGRKRMGTVRDSKGNLVKKNGVQAYTIDKNTFEGQISQLQARLIELGYGWPDWKWQRSENGHKKGNPVNMKMANRPAGSGHTKASGFLIPLSQIYSYWSKHGGRPGSKSWLLINRYIRVSFNPDHQRTIGGETWDHYNSWEAELQMRLDDYPGKLDGLYMGGKHGVIDGRYGDLVAKGIKIFEGLAQIPSSQRSKNGNWLTPTLYKELKKGLHRTGEFDLPTHLAVYFFQNANGIKPTGIVDEKTRKALSPTVDRWVTIKGENRYKPDKLFEPQASRYEAEVWGRTSSADDNHRRRTFFYYGMTGASYLKKNGFDIYITYGPYPEKTIRMNGNKDDGMMASKLYAKHTNFNTTVKAIRNIQITGVDQVLDASGNPIEEVYTFIAQDLD